MQKIIRAAIYIRVSTNKQAEEGFSISQQKDRLQKYCAAMGWQVVHVYIDDGYSGGSLDRPAMSQVIDAARGGDFDLVLVDKLDRLSRSQFDTLYLITKVFGPAGVSFVSRAEAFDTSTDLGRAMVGILSVFAELERSRIKDRLKDGKVGRAKEGLWNGGLYAPIGYRYTDGQLIVDNFEATLIRDIFSRVAALEPINAIMTDLNKRGLHGQYGPWNARQVYNMLRNPLYIGILRYKGEEYPAQSAPIVDRDTWDRVQSVMDDRARKNEHAKSSYASKVLSGMIFCGCCGARYFGFKQDGRSYYKCYSRAKCKPKMIRDPNCKNKIWRMEALDEVVFSAVLALNTEDAIRSVQRRRDDERPRVLQDKIDMLTKQIGKLMNLYALDVVDVSTLTEQIKPLQEQKSALQAELASLPSDSSKSPADVLELTSAFSDVVSSGDPLKIRAALSDLISHITLTGDEVAISWSF